jgi:pyruvate formate lyase activating enzyme
MPKMDQEIISHNPVMGWIWDIKKYALHDGPGIRTTIFFKGCPLRCLFCCNPESQNFYPDILWIGENCIRCNLCLEVCPTNAIFEDEKGGKRVDAELCDLCGLCVNRCPGEALNQVGRHVTVDGVLREVAKDAVFYLRSGGGLTLSGGEPTAQADFAYELLRQYKMKELGLHTAIETCGYVKWSKLAVLLEYTDLVLYDIKHMDSLQHRRMTGISNKLILQNAIQIARSHKQLIIRFPLIPGYNDNEENIRRTGEFARELPGVEEINLLPYHRLGEPKYARLGQEYTLSGMISLTPERIASIRSTMENFGLRVRIGG